MPEWCTSAFFNTPSNIRLKRVHDKESPCRKSLLVSNGSDRFDPTLAELVVLLNGMQNILSFAGILNVDIVAYRDSLLRQLCSQ